MKLCNNCSQALAESVKICPNCGSEVADGLTGIDSYRILEVIHEGRASILFKAIEEEAEEPRPTKAVAGKNTVMWGPPSLLSNRFS